MKLLKLIKDYFFPRPKYKTGDVLESRSTGSLEITIIDVLGDLYLYTRSDIPPFEVGGLKIDAPYLGHFKSIEQDYFLPMFTFSLDD